MSLTKQKLPDFLATGEQARLIPVGSEAKKEGRATSVLLANLSAVHEFAQVIFGAIGMRIGLRANIDMYTEVVLKDKSGREKLRPDGLIIINTGRTQWKALVEAKISNAELNAEQIKDYLALAKKYNIDAVITLSNQYSAMPTHHPINFKKSDLKGVDLFHFSWMFILTEAILLLKSMGVEDEDQRFLLNEMVRYFDHDSVGVLEFKSMNKEWKDINTSVRSGSTLSKTSPEVENTIISWHQEARDLCLIMSRTLAVPVTLRLNRKHTNDPVARVKDDCEQLVKTHNLTCELDIPNAVSPLTVTADIKRRAIDCTMTLNAPKDKQRPSARLNWLLRQLKNTDLDDIFVRVSTMGRGNNPQAKLNEIRENPDAFLTFEGNQIQPIGFDVILSRDFAGKFSGRNTFIQAVEEAVKDFYSAAGQYLEGWTPPAPKIKKSKNNDIHEIDEPEKVTLITKDDKASHIQEASDAAHEKAANE